MKGNVLQNFAPRASKELTPFQQDGESFDDLGPFAILRGVRDFARFLQLRKKDGDSISFGYAWLERVEYAPSCITLYFTGQKVKIIGRNLNSEIRPNVRLHDFILRHRVPWIRESDATSLMLTDRDVTIVEEIEIGVNNI